MRRWILASCGWLLLVAAAHAQPPRHLLFIAIDTLRADHVGCYGYSLATTPTIDRLATEGTRFAQATATAPWTLPSFASMFTGLYPTRHGAGVHGPERHLQNSMPTPIAAEATTLGEHLRALGYRTHAVTSNPYLLLGMQRGFERFECRSMAADRVGALSRAWLSTQNGEEPFFHFVHFNDPHEPTDVADAFLRELGFGEEILRHPQRRALERWGEGESYLGQLEDVDAAGQLLDAKLAMYDAAILQVDLEIGRIVETLRRRQLLHETLIVIVSDHGEEFLDHAARERERAEDPRGIWGIGHGHTLYEEQLRVPWIVRGPGVPAGLVVEQGISLVDFMPTLLGWLGQPLPAELDGRDRRAWIDDPERESLPALAESIAYGLDLWSWSRWPDKLITRRGEGMRELFELARDPFERTNLLPDEPADSLLAEARRKLEWLAERAPAGGEAASLDPEALEGLRSLGYVE